MISRSRKSSSRITLVIVGAAAMTACGQNEDLRRDVYASRDDCVKDWGDEQKCEEQAKAGTSSGGRGGFWYGPAYRSGQFGWVGVARPHGSIDSARPGSRSVATSHISRGGFGASGAAHVSGG